MRRTGPVLVAMAMATGCLADQLEPPPSGVFACRDDTDCPSTQSCLFDRCQEGEVPTIEIRAPEPRAVVSVITEGEDPAATVLVPINIGGQNLELVDPGDPAAVGEGVVELYVDGEASPQLILTAGSLVAGVAGELELDNTPGPHRIRAVAVLSDDRRYDGPQTDVTQLVWIDDGLPHVALVAPTPGTRFSVDESPLRVEVTTINFDMVRSMTSAAPGNVGHAHVHYDQSFPACVDVPACDNGYIGIVAPQEAGVFDTASFDATLPASGEGMFTLTAILRSTNHTVFLGDNDEFSPIYDTIMIERDADVSVAQEP